MSLWKLKGLVVNLDGKGHVACNREFALRLGVQHSVWLEIRELDSDQRFVLGAMLRAVIESGSH